MDGDEVTTPPSPASAISTVPAVGAQMDELREAYNRLVTAYEFREEPPELYGDILQKSPAGAGMIVQVYVGPLVTTVPAGLLRCENVAQVVDIVIGRAADDLCEAVLSLNEMLEPLVAYALSRRQMQQAMIVARAGEDAAPPP